MTPADGSSEITLDEARPHLVEMLDEIRKRKQTILLREAEYAALAHRYGMSYAEVGELLDLSESGVRGIVRRAERGPGDAVSLESCRRTHRADGEGGRRECAAEGQ
ncbi:hypothetical protein [Nocardia wallacei]|uniref:hypothetical protein n=1 Tax=Nocardia wallacei TaxID=480035 RepID=UPI002456B2B2|nr:hypothetical protein [Nocardia wallacei]